MRGKPKLIPPLVDASTDHPRRCGENCPTVCQHQSISGSPPQVRGKLKNHADTSNALGITPAGAGKTLQIMAQAAICRDHPRRCGENFESFSGGVLAKGSPPQVRGKLNCNRLICWLQRITPAGAGKTLKRSFRNQPFCS